MPWSTNKDLKMPTLQLLPFYFPICETPAGLMLQSQANTSSTVHMEDHEHT